MSAPKQCPPCLKGGGPEGRGDKNPCPPNPCRGCHKRHAHCHSECGPYLAYFAWNRQENERRLRSQDADQMKISAIMKAKRLARLMKGRKT